MSERISESTATNDLSRLVSALNLALNSQNDAVIPSGQFGFKATIQTDKTVLSSTDFDFEFDDQQEQEALEKEFSRQKKKYSKRYQGTHLKEKIIDTLLRKGYNYEHIKELLNREGALDDE